MHLDHVALNVKNIEASVKWYQDELNADVLYCDETWAMLSVGKTKIALTISEQHPPHIAFEVSSQSELPGSPLYHRDGSLYVYSRDPDGNMIEYIWWPDKL